MLKNTVDHLRALKSAPRLKPSGSTAIVFTKGAAISDGVIAPFVDKTSRPNRIVVLFRMIALDIPSFHIDDHLRGKGHERGKNDPLSSLRLLIVQIIGEANEFRVHLRQIPQVTFLRELGLAHSHTHKTQRFLCLCLAFFLAFSRSSSRRNFALGGFYLGSRCSQRNLDSFFFGRSSSATSQVVEVGHPQTLFQNLNSRLGVTLDCYSSGIFACVCTPSTLLLESWVACSPFHVNRHGKNGKLLQTLHARKLGFGQVLMSSTFAYLCDQGTLLPEFWHG